jgi:hypothetical protein
MEYHSTIKKKEIMSFAGKWVEITVIVSSQISQAQKDKCHMLFSYADSGPKK